MFILCFYPGLIFALNCDNSLTVFMLKASCLCHERSFSSISIDSSQNRNSGIRCKLYEHLPGSAGAPVPPLHPPLVHVFSKCQYPKPCQEWSRGQSGPNPATAAHLGVGKARAGGAGWSWKWKDKERWGGEESTERDSGCKDNKRALLGCLLEKPVSHPTQHVLVSIYSYEGSSFKYNLTEDFRMDCKICPANLNCTFQSPWECRRNADNTKLAMLSVTKDMYAFKTSWKNIINFLF